MESQTNARPETPDFIGMRVTILVTCGIMTMFNVPKGGRNDTSP